MLRIPHCLDNRFTDVGEVVSLMHRPHFTPPKHFLILISVRSWVNTGVIMRLQGLGKLKEFIHLIGTRNLDLSGCNIVPQLRYRVSLTFRSETYDWKGIWRKEEAILIWRKLTKQLMKLLVDFFSPASNHLILKKKNFYWDSLDGRSAC
jgi:hypothetical protein